MVVYVSKALKELYPKIDAVLGSRLKFAKIKYKYLDTHNLWARDYMPVSINGEMFKFKYKGYDYPQLKVKDECWDWLNPIRSDIVLDGGNVVQNIEVAFITEQVFKNNTLPRMDTMQFLKDIFDKKIIYLPVEPGDELGHADGIIRFVNDRTVLINDYRLWVSQTWYEYAIKLERVLKNSGFDFVRLPWALSKGPVMTEAEFRLKYPYADDFNPGVGYYINYLQVKHLIFAPVFGFKEDKEALDTLARCFPESEIIPVDCMQLSMLGGLMNCISWEYDAPKRVA
jgi:agmatine deiminase